MGLHGDGVTLKYPIRMQWMRHIFCCPTHLIRQRSDTLTLRLFDWHCHCFCHESFYNKVHKMFSIWATILLLRENQIENEILLKSIICLVLWRIQVKQSHCAVQLTSGFKERPKNADNTNSVMQIRLKTNIYWPSCKVQNLTAKWEKCTAKVKIEHFLIL